MIQGNLKDTDITISSKLGQWPILSVIGLGLYRYSLELSLGNRSIDYIDIVSQILSEIILTYHEVLSTQ